MPTRALFPRALPYRVPTSSSLHFDTLQAPFRAGRQARLAVTCGAVEPKKILMMGGTRFIGVYLARQLVEQGALSRAVLMILFV